MMENFDRECCQRFNNALTDNIPEGWQIVKTDFHDPGMTLIFEHNAIDHVGKPTVSVTIDYGRPDEKSTSN